MLSDRSYMRGATTERGTSALVWLISSLLSAFVMEVFFRTIGVRAGPDLTSQAALTITGLQGLRLWTILTHAWLHSTENLLHIIAVVAGLSLLGRELIPTIGAKKFLAVFFTGIVVGALVWSAINWHRGGVLIGASAGVYGLLAFYTLLRPGVELNFLLFFFIPVSVRLKTVLYGMAIVALLASGFYEVFGATAPFPYAPSAHIGGLIAGWLCYRFGQINGRTAEMSSGGLETSSDFDTSSDSDPELLAAATPSASAQRQKLKVEVDRILDKINSTGLRSLTPAEKSILDRAKNQLSGT